MQLRKHSRLSLVSGVVIRRCLGDQEARSQLAVTNDKHMYVIVNFIQIV